MSPESQVAESSPRESLPSTANMHMLAVVPPKSWQSVMFGGLPKSDTKAMSYIVRVRLLPGASWLASPRCKKPHDGMTDAALITTYGSRTLSVSGGTGGDNL